MPAVAWTWSPLPQPSRKERSEFEHPAPDRFVGQIEPAFGKQLLDIAVAEGEAQIQPYRVLDDRRREAMAALGEGGHGSELPNRDSLTAAVMEWMPPAAASLAPRSEYC